MTYGATIQTTDLRCLSKREREPFISYLDLDTSRQVGLFNSLGFEFYQNGGNLKGS